MGWWDSLTPAVHMHAKHHDPLAWDTLLEQPQASSKSSPEVPAFTHTGTLWVCLPTKGSEPLHQYTWNSGAFLFIALQWPDHRDSILKQDLGPHLPLCLSASKHPCSFFPTLSATTRNCFPLVCNRIPPTPYSQELPIKKPFFPLIPFRISLSWI